jgi:hypothetical protein
MLIQKTKGEIKNFYQYILVLLKKAIFLDGTVEFLKVWNATIQTVLIWRVICRWLNMLTPIERA